MSCHGIILLLCVLWLLLTDTEFIASAGILRARLERLLRQVAARDRRDRKGRAA